MLAFEWNGMGEEEEDELSFLGTDEICACSTYGSSRDILPVIGGMELAAGA